MYSIVLLMAMSSGGDAPACHRGGCGGCAGVSAGCCGCGGGGGLFSCFHRHHGCGGCGGCGGCVGTCGGGCISYTCGGGCVGTCGGCFGGEVISEEKTDEEGTGDEEETKGVSTPAPAKMIVSMPAKAKLTINGVAAKTSAKTQRTFVSPTLQGGRSYIYNVKAEVLVDGKSVVLQKRVTVRAGSEVKVDLKAPAASVVQR